MGCLKARVRQSDQHLFLFFYTTNTNLLVQKDPKVCMISALDGERSLFRSLPKNSTEKHPQFSVDFTESAVILSCLTHCAPTLKTTWYVIHTSVWCDMNSHSDDASDISSFSFSGRTWHVGTHKFHCWNYSPDAKRYPLVPDVHQTMSSRRIMGDTVLFSLRSKWDAFFKKMQHLHSM